MVWAIGKFVTSAAFFMAAAMQLSQSRPVSAAELKREHSGSPCVDHSNFFCKVGVYKLNGSIDSNVSNDISENISNIKSIEINSSSGDDLSGINIGRLIRKFGIKLIINGDCIGVCAKYILPAGEKIFVKKGSRIAFSSINPASFVDFLAQKSDSIKIDFAKIDEERQNYKLYRKNVIERDENYFSDIFIDSAYLYRFRELIRIYPKNDRCEFGGKFIFVLDKRYLDAFGIFADFEDSDFDFRESDWSELVKREKLKIIVGFDGGGKVNSGPADRERNDVCAKFEKNSRDIF